MSPEDEMMVYYIAECIACGDVSWYSSNPHSKAYAEPPGRDGILPGVRHGCPGALEWEDGGKMKVLKILTPDEFEKWKGGEYERESKEYRKRAERFAEMFGDRFGD